MISGAAALPGGGALPQSFQTLPEALISVGQLERWERALPITGKPPVCIFYSLSDREVKGQLLWW